jgi:uncharacterized protein (DUF2384 family)
MATQLLDRPQQDARILTEAVVRIAEFWGLTNPKLGQVLGVSATTVSRFRAHSADLDPQSKSFEAGQYLARLFRSLDALLGSDDAAAKRWLVAFNDDLDARPVDLLDSFKGLMTLCDYVDGFRARV